MNLKLTQMNLLIRMRTMAARRRKSRKNRSSIFACLAFSRQFSCCRTPHGQDDGSQFAKNMPKVLTMNDLQYNRGFGGAKSVKVCQSDCVGLQSASRRRTASAERLAHSIAFPGATARFRSDGFGRIRGRKIKVAQGGSRQIKVNQGIFKHFFWPFETCPSNF